MIFNTVGEIVEKVITHDNVSTSTDSASQADSYTNLVVTSDVERTDKHVEA
jgi:hypothetical protein